MSSCRYLSSVSTCKTLKMLSSEKCTCCDSIPDVEYVKSAIFVNPVVVTTKNNHRYITTRTFVKGFKGTELEFLNSDSAYIFSNQIPVQYYDEMGGFCGSIRYTECITINCGIFASAMAVEINSDSIRVFRFNECVYYERFNVIDSSEKLVKVPSEYNGTIDVAFPL